jgi:hypothetical protein
LTLTVGCRAGRDRDGSSTVPFEQIGQSAVKRLWRQKSVDKGAALQDIPL